MHGMETVIKNRFGQLLSNKPSERDVTVKLTCEDGMVRYCNGFITELGSPVYGCTLDPEPEFELECARPELRLTCINFFGRVLAIEAWTQMPNGPRTVVRQNYPEGVSLDGGTPLLVVGPAF